MVALIGNVVIMTVTVLLFAATLNLGRDEERGSAGERNGDVSLES